MTGDRQRCLDAGMDDYLSKPVEMEELEAALARLEPAARRAPASLPETVPGRPPATSAATPPPPPVATPAKVDWKRLRKVCLNDPDRIREMVEIYLGQSEELMTAIRSAVSAGNAKQLAQMAHKLAGSSASSGMNGVVAELRQIEALGQEEKVAEAAPLLAPLELLLRDVQGQLRSYLEGGVPAAGASPTAGAFPASPAPSTLSPEEARLVDWPRLLSICLNDLKRVRELVDMYVAQSEELLQNLQSAVDTGQARLFEQCAHRLRGTSATFGVNAIVQLLQELETACVNGRLTEVAPRMPQLGELLKQSNRLLVRLAANPPAMPVEATPAPPPAARRPADGGASTAPLPAPLDVRLMDLTRLQRACQGDQQRVRDMIELYLAQSDAMLQALAVAVGEGAAAEVQQAAHQWASASSSCGVVGMVAPLRELEACGREHRSEALTEHYQQVVNQHRRVTEELRRCLSLPAGQLAGLEPT
jgi:HPt (histidine-containing phosphotransfer) domain-containing protein